MNKFTILLTTIGILSLCQFTHGMATEQIGPDSAKGHQTVAQPGWPKGIEEVPRHPSRVYSIWVNGGESFNFLATPEGINELMGRFSKARLRDHEIRLEAGEPTVNSFDKKTFQYNVSLQITAGIARAIGMDKNDTETGEPRLTIYLGKDPAALFKQLKLPANAIVSSGVAIPGFEGQGAKPARKAWYGSAQFEDGSPAVDFEHGLSTHVTLWEKEAADGIDLAQVSRDGSFKAILSDAEIAGLEKSDAWLTVSVGNWASVPKKDDTQYPAQNLAREKEKAKPQKISRPTPYYGRILFEDGTPAVLDPALWQSAKINVEFPYTSGGSPDADGYFMVYFDVEQLEKLLTEKPRKNIYIPTSANSSTARDIYPAALLSQDKEKVVPVKIPKPGKPAAK